MAGIGRACPTMYNPPQKPYSDMYGMLTNLPAFPRYFQTKVSLPLDQRGTINVMVFIYVLGVPEKI